MKVKECREPPCIHVVKDERKKIYAVFFEDSLGNVIWVESDKIRKSAEALEKVIMEGFREASGNEIDRLASRYLGASPAEEEWEE